MNSHLSYLDLHVRQTDVSRLTVSLDSLCLKSQLSSFPRLAHIPGIGKYILNKKCFAFFCLSVFSCGWEWEGGKEEVWYGLFFGLV